MMKQPVRVAIAGLGNRGRETYANYQKLFPDEMRIVAVADTDPTRVQEAARTFGLGEGALFDSASALLAGERLADILFVCVPDRLHEEVAVPALEKGYHLLLEKPIAPGLASCRKILEAAQRSGRHVLVCHVLRYTPFYCEIKRILDSGELGELVTAHQIENVGYYHMAHSFVRGNWRSAEASSPMILQKCCHDLDILLWLMGKRPSRVSSFGDLFLFRPEKAPKGASTRCLSDCEAKEGCVFDAEKIYITDELTGIRSSKIDWPCSVLTPIRTEDAVYQALREGPYGRCVYHSDNDVVDHQVVNILLEDGATVSLTMSGLTSRQYRALKIMGTKADLEADMGENWIRVTPFGGETREIDVTKLSDDFSGHGGGDNRMIKELLALVRGEAPGNAMSSVENSMDSHFAAFAAERSRLNGGESITIGE